MKFPHEANLNYRNLRAVGRHYVTKYECARDEHGSAL